MLSSVREGKDTLHRKNHLEADGSITVYLSLILLLILSLILTVTEGARVGTAKAFAGRAFSTAMDSVLADYYGPLWKEYHIFGLYTGEESDIDQEKRIAEKLSEYMSYTFEPERDLYDKGVNLYDIATTGVLVEGETSFMDDQGELLIKEAIDYMKYREVGEGMKALLDKLSLYEEPQKVSYIYEKKEDVENQLVDIDKGILKLMELLDGISTGSKGIKITKSNSLAIKDYFVKKIVLRKPTKESVGINQEKVFQALKDHYVNPMIDFTDIDKDINRISAALEQMDSINAEYEQSEASDMSGDISEIEIDIEKRINEQLQIISQSEADAKASGERILGLIQGIEPIIGKAINAVDGILLRTETAVPLIKEYETFLTGYKNQMDESTYNGLDESLQDIKKYVNVKGGYDFKGMKAILKQDANILSQAEEYLNEGENALLQQQYERAATFFDHAAYEIQGYQTNGLELDYSTLVLEDSSMESPLKTINNLLNTGIAGLVIESGQISDKKLTQETLPSQIAELGQDNTDFLSKLSAFFQNCISDGDNLDVSSLFQNFVGDAKIGSIVKKGIGNLPKQLLYQEYLNAHFDKYRAEICASTKKPAVLDYEQEYLLAENRSDKENLCNMVSRIVYLRTLLDFTAVIRDSTRRNEAKAAACALVGFTGLPILVAVTQILILLAWALAEALLDTTILLQDREVPVIKNSIILQLPELFLINRSFLKEKAKLVKYEKGLSMTYPDYLRMFLILKGSKKLAYHSLDLMQENIRCRYNAEDFDITRCLYGFKAEMEYNIPYKFIGISMVQKLLGSNERGIDFTESMGYSY